MNSLVDYSFKASFSWVSCVVHHLKPSVRLSSLLKVCLRHMVKQWTDGEDDFLCEDVQMIV